MSQEKEVILGDAALVEAGLVPWSINRLKARRREGLPVPPGHRMQGSQCLIYLRREVLAWIAGMPLHSDQPAPQAAPRPRRRGRKSKAELRRERQATGGAE